MLVLPRALARADEVVEQEAEILQRMIAAAGPYLSRRQRWIMRQLRVKPLTEKALAAVAALAVEYRKYKDVPRCVRHDINRLTSLGLVREHGTVHAVCPACPVEL
jgi:hypothetical protein